MRDLIYMILISLIFGVLLFVGLVFVRARQCREAYSSFENRYNFFRGCQVNIGRWYPADMLRIIDGSDCDANAARIQIDIPGYELEGIERVDP